MFSVLFSISRAIFVTFSNDITRVKVEINNKLIIFYTRNESCSVEEQYVRIMTRQANRSTDCHKVNWNVQCGVRQFLNRSIEYQRSVIWSYISHNIFTLFHRKTNILIEQKKRRSKLRFKFCNILFCKCRFILLLCYCCCLVAL